ncbi:MAG TPA: Gfo/Idh/MocA family oxidoreductase [Planctomycetaceae bacterium]|nr:Gfo/Idh/MocA family oxidoreductase [Planctomycetaceae bacterium]
MQQRRTHRRDFLKTSSLAALAGASLPYWFTVESSRALGFFAASERPVVGCIGTGDRWQGGIWQGLMPFGDVAAVCDVDLYHLRAGQEAVRRAQHGRGVERPVDMYEDYRKILDRKDIDVVTIVTPDHWHSKIAIEALKAGKDIYCEKPLTLTIDEGKQIIKVLNETKRVFQVGTQQRSEGGNKETPQYFLTAVALVKAGRIGSVKKVTCHINGAPGSGPIPIAEVPLGMNWDMWLGQAPYVDYRSGNFGNNPRYPESRTHYEFRWWYEYSGGKMTDWGAHHVDIGQWAIGMDHSGPTSVQGTAVHPVPLKDGRPTQDDRYNVATTFNVTCQYPNGVELVITSEGENGIMFEGTEGRIFVNRGKVTGKPVEDLKTNPLPEDAIVKLYKGKTPAKDNAHMTNFFECIKDRTQPISDVYTHHRSMTTLHLANIAIRLGRKIEWDAEKEQIVGDKEANSWLAREQRKGYEIVV